MLDGIPLIDAHIHAARLPTLKASWKDWAARYGKNVPMAELYDAGGTLRPDRFDAYLEEQGVDVALLLCEYSPKATGIQPIEDLLPIRDYNPRRFRLIANLNPHFHYPMVEELDRQLEFGAVALKLHPVHGGFSVNNRELYSTYAACQERRLPVVIHCGTSTFPGSTNRYGDPAPIEDVARDFPELTIVLAHGGRGWWYDAAAFMTLMHPNMWIEISGLPPKKLPEYYAKYDFERLARKMIFGTDWPGVPGNRANALAVRELGLERETLEVVFYKNALQVYNLHTVLRDSFDFD